MRCDLAILSVNKAETEAMSYEIFRERLWRLRYLHVAVKVRLICLHRRFLLRFVTISNRRKYRQCKRAITPKLVSIYARSLFHQCCAHSPKEETKDKS